MRKLTPTIVRSIRKMREDKKTLREIGEKYSLTLMPIYRALRMREDQIDKVNAPREKKPKVKKERKAAAATA